MQRKEKRGEMFCKRKKGSFFKKKRVAWKCNPVFKIQYPMKTDAKIKDISDTNKTYF